MKKLGSIWLLLLLVNACYSQQDLTKIRQAISAAAEKIQSKAVAWRRDIHEHPELGNNEYRTAKLIAAHLRSLGMEVKEGVAKTGVVGILKGGKPGPCIALRSDMDALPIEEKTGLPFASKEKGKFNGADLSVMHACGHDVHMAILMSTAEVLAGMKNELKGTVKFIFQPSEEGPPAGEEGGAPLMVKEGVMDDPKVEAIFGLHLQPDIEIGNVAYKSGPFMAAAIFYKLTVLGKGAHGSTPWLGVDPITTAAQIMLGFQTIVSRQSELTKTPVIITVGKIQGGTRGNIIPDNCVLDGTVRTFDTAIQRSTMEKMRLMAEKIAEGNGAKTELTYAENAAVTYNDPKLVQRMLPSMRSAIGENHVVERDWTTNAEDFAYYGLKTPAFYFDLGGMSPGNDPLKMPSKHTAFYMIDENCIKTGVKVFCNLVVDYFNNAK
ncbi:MAG: amidohydrolase [Chitinophagaceae bacterium]|nr:amidohydrolase [Chitinophagaceae bacterium]